MRGEHLAAILAVRVMGWGVSPDRFLTGQRGWMPRWRFQPTEKLNDAFRLLDHAAPQHYEMRPEEGGYFVVQVRIGVVTGEARDKSRARAITHAVARAFGIEVDL